MKYINCTLFACFFLYEIDICKIKQQQKSQSKNILLQNRPCCYATQARCYFWRIFNIFFYFDKILCDLNSFHWILYYSVGRWISFPKNNYYWQKSLQHSLDSMDQLWESSQNKTWMFLPIVCHNVLRINKLSSAKTATLEFKNFIRLKLVKNLGSKAWNFFFQMLASKAKF